MSKPPPKRKKASSVLGCAVGDGRSVVESLETLSEPARLREELYRSQAYNRGLIEASADGLLTIDRDGVITDVNERMCEMTGHPREELIGSEFASHCLDPERARDGVKLTFENGGVSDYVLTLAHGVAEGREFSFNASLYKDEDGKVAGIFAAARDITMRRQAERALQAERKRFNDILEMLPAYLVLLAPDYHVPFANRFFRERFGEAKGRRCFEYLFNRTEPCEVCETYTVLKTGAPHHWEWTGPDGRDYDIHDFPFTDADGSPLIMEMGIDVTEQKKLEKELAGSQAYNRGLIEASADGLITVGRTGRITDVNEEMCRMTGRSRDELVGRAFASFFADPKRARKGVRETFEKEVVNDYALTLVTAKGSELVVSFNAALYRDQQGEVAGIFASARDITEQKRLENEMRDSELYTRSLIEASLDALMATDETGVITDVNAEMEALTGRPRVELIGTRLRNYTTDPERAAAGIEQVLREGSLRDYELTIRAEDGRETDVSFNATTFLDQHGELSGIFGAARDMTERKRFEEERQVARFFDLALDMAVITSLDEGRFVRVNPAFEQLLGWTAEELCTSPFERFVHPDDLEPTAKAFEEHLQGPDVIDFDNRYLCKDGSYRWLRWRTTPPTESRVVYATARDVTEEKRREEERESEFTRIQALARLSAELVSAATGRDIVKVAMTQAVIALEAASGAVGILDPISREIRSDQSGLGEEAARRFSRFSLDDDLPAAVCVRSRRGLWFESIEVLREEFPETAALFERAGVRSTFVVPLETGAETIGFLSARYPTVRVFTDEDRAFAATVADQCAQALVRARLFEQSQRRLVFTQALQHLSAGLTGAQTPAEVLEIISAEAFGALGASSGSLGLVNEERTQIAIEFSGAPDELSERFPLISIDSELPAAFCVRENAGLWYETVEELEADPSVGATVIGDAGYRALVCLPMESENETIGYLSGRFSEPHRFDEEERAFTLSVADLCGQAIVRARLFEQREQALIRSHALQEVSAGLAAASEPSQALRVIFDRALSALGADGGSISLLSSDGLRLESEYVGLSQEAAARLASYPIDSSLPAATSVRENRAIWIESIDQARQESSELPAVLAEVDAQALVAIPLRLRGEAIGCLGARYREPHLFSLEERALGMSLGEQCAQALVRARLYEEREQRAEASFVLDRVGDGIFRLDDDDRIMLWNPAAERMTGVAAAEALGKRANEVFDGWGDPSKVLEPAPPDRPAARRSLPFAFGGAELWLSISGVRTASGAVFAFHDVTVEHELEQRQHDFIATVSHELRTPLASVYGAVRTLERSEIDPRDRELVLRAAIDQSERLRGLIDEILLANEAGSTQMRMRDVVIDPLEVVHDVAEGARPRLPAGLGLEVSASEPLPPLHVDPDRLHQVLANLVDNAIKFSPQGGCVHIAVAASEESVLFDVADEGPGIPASERERIFDRFYRLDPRQTRGVGGSGLGLFICRQLVERMGGKIGVNVRESGGSVFWVELPRERRRPTNR